MISGTFELLIDGKHIKHSPFVSDLLQEMAYLIEEEEVIPYTDDGVLDFETIIIRPVKEQST